MINKLKATTKVYEDWIVAVHKGLESTKKEMGMHFFLSNAN